ncbi:unnamed protein product [Brugia pahangi]|uniref:Uncharacterized protein n=1 Tax=Brugia pahangi TaxID=6280 RepID=A0A0N4TXW8_BRUPA|nr:unnamed protein product [Brugia pahangi]
MEENKKTNIKDHHLVQKHRDRIISGYVSVSQRRQNFDGNQKITHNNFEKIVSVNDAKKIAINDKEMLKEHEVFDIKFNPAEMYNESNAFMPTVEELGSIEQLKSFFEKRSKVVNH